MATFPGGVLVGVLLVLVLVLVCWFLVRFGSVWFGFRRRVATHANNLEPLTLPKHSTGGHAHGHKVSRAPCRTSLSDAHSVPSLRSIASQHHTSIRHGSSIRRIACGGMRAPAGRAMPQCAGWLVSLRRGADETRTDCFAFVDFGLSVGGLRYVRHISSQALVKSRW